MPVTMAAVAVAAARVIRAADCRSLPWKNGGGATTEICVHPPGAGLGDFDWRVSMATVASDGPFSVFAGVDRTLTLLAGGGLRLVISAAAPVVLGSGSAPLSFPADVPTQSALTGAPVTDLNVMTRRGVWRHTVVPLAFEGGEMQVSEQQTTATCALWWCHQGSVEIAGCGGSVRLGPQNAWLVENLPPTAWRVMPMGAAALFRIDLDESPASGYRV